MVSSSFFLLTLCSADSVVRLYRNYDPTLEQGPLQMVSAFRALGETVQTRQGSGLIMDWKQSAGNLLVGGDSRVIKVWDAQTEVQGYVSTVLSFTLDASNFFTRTWPPIPRAPSPLSCPTLALLRLSLRVLQMVPSNYSTTA